MHPTKTVALASILLAALTQTGQAADWSYTQDFSTIPVGDLSASQRAGFTWVTEEASGSDVKVISVENNNRVLSCVAAVGTPGKASISQDFGRVAYAGDTVVAGGRYYIPELPVGGSLFMLDIQVRDSPIATKPGYRFKVSAAGQLHINFKAIPNRSEYNTGVAVPIGRPFLFESRALLSSGASGAIEVRIDGASVYTLRGNNLPEVGRLTYGEFGATANSGSQNRTVLIDDIFMQVLGQQSTTPPPPPAPLFQAKINFQPAPVAVPAGYVADTNQQFGERGNGLRFGWTTSFDETRVRNVHADPRFDTLILMQKNGIARVWEIAVPNGLYGVTLLCGDPSFTDQVNSMIIEGRTVVDPDGEGNFDLYETTVEVSDGRLTIAPASGARNAKICAIEVMQLPQANQ